MASPAGYLRLLRWPGAVTAAANALTGYLLVRRVGGPGPHEAAVAVAIAGALVYLGGVVLNDVADARRDETLHPERPIPAGDAERGPAGTLAGALILGGTLLAFLVGGTGAGLAIAAAAAFAVVYDIGAKRWRLPGAIAMGGARGANAAAGMLASGLTFDGAFAAPALATTAYPLVIAAYTLLLTLVSTFEGRRPSAFTAGSMVVTLVLPVALLWPWFRASWWSAPAFPLLALTASLIAGAREAQIQPGPGVGAIVRRAVFGFLLIDATFLMGNAWYEAGFWAILTYVGLRFLLARLRS